MESILRLRGINAACAAVALVLLSAVASAELAKWDQARVTKIAEELAESLKSLRKEIHAAPRTTDPARQRARYVALDDVRIMTNSATLLAKRLQAGEDREATFAIWRRLDLLRRDFVENARKSDIEDAILKKIGEAGDVLMRLTPYYAGDEGAGG